MLHPIHYNDYHLSSLRFCRTLIKDSAAMEDIDKVLAYQIKKDIADRYFGLRKLIEQDSAAYLDTIVDATTEFEAGIGLDLIRLYILLCEPDLIRQFQQLLDLDGDFFYDAYLCSSPTIRARLFASEACPGITRRMRYQRLFFSIYERLQARSESYRRTRQEIEEQWETIVEQINLFYRKNDLQNILSFIKTLDQHDEHLLTGGRPDPGDRAALENKMHLQPPDSVETLLPRMPVLPSLDLVKERLLPLLKIAFRAQPELDVKAFCRG